VVSLSRSRRTSRVATTSGRRGRRSREIDVVYEDDSIVVINKPAGLLSVPLERNPAAPSAQERLEERYRSHGKRRLFAVHRIDQDTSGLVVFARSVSAQRVLVEQFKRREPERVYWAIVQGHPDPPAGLWRDRLAWNSKALIQKVAGPGDADAEEAISDYKVVEGLRNASLLEVRLRTGRRNQIRIQAALRGHPLIGERRYLSDTPRAAVIHFERQALHAVHLTFRHPRDGRTITLQAPPPPDFVDLLARLRLRSRRRIEP
jgi:23S rRNA pseudouridine1911/1915/1917 synthase